jgi:hypothetical protein
MKIFMRFLWGTVLAFVLCTTAGAVEEASQPVPLIEIQESTHNFGQVSQGADVLHDFRVVNKGNAPLEIQSVKPG